MIYLSSPCMDCSPSIHVSVGLLVSHFSCFTNTPVLIPDLGFFFFFTPWTQTCNKTIIFNCFHLTAQSSLGFFFRDISLIITLSSAIQERFFFSFGALMNILLVYFYIVQVWRSSGEMANYSPVLFLMDVRLCSEHLQKEISLPLLRCSGTLIR